MALVYLDRAMELSRTEGSGAYDLDGAVIGYQAFTDVGDGNTCYYAATDGRSWEVGLGTYVLANSRLIRTTILDGSNGTSPVNWLAGTKTIWVDYPASAIAAAGAGTVTAVSVATTNGFAGSSSGGATPQLTLSTTINSPVLAGNGTAIAGATTTGSGSTAVLQTSPVLVTPTLGVATATSINKVEITAPATAVTLTLIDGTTVTGPAASGTIMTLGNAETVTGDKTFTGHVLLDDTASSGYTEVRKDASPLNYTGTRAAFVMQQRDAAAGSAGLQYPGAMLQMASTGNGVVNSTLEYSDTIWWGATATMNKSGDGSGHSYTAIGQLGAYGGGGYNELGGFIAELTNVGSNLGTVAGAELLVKDSPDAGATSYSTRMYGVASRLAKYNTTTRRADSFVASSEGSQALDAVLAVNPTGTQTWKLGIDLTEATFSTGNTMLLANDSSLAWLKAGGTSEAAIKVNASDVLEFTTAGGSLFDAAQRIAVDDASNNAVTNVSFLRHTTSGTPGNGIGTGLVFEAETSSGNVESGVMLQAFAKDTTSTSEDFDLQVKLMIAGAAPVEVFKFNNDGHFTIGTASLATDNGFRLVSALPQSWEVSVSVANGNCYYYDATNNKIPVVFSPNAPDSSLVVSSAGVRLTGSSLSLNPPVTKTADFTVDVAENYLINNKAGSSCTVTLPTASACPGRRIVIKTIQAQTTVSASSNVIPLAGGAAGTAILSANAGRWAELVSNGTNWEIMSGVV